MTELERVCKSVIEAYKEFDENGESNYQFPWDADKLAHACLVMMQALKAIVDTDKQESWNPHQLIVAIRHDEHEARYALSKVEEIMKETNEGYVCNHCGVPTGNYQLCDKCAFKILEKIKIMKGPG